jgi:hypothetical protein
VECSLIRTIQLQNANLFPEMLKREKEKENANGQINNTNLIKNEGNNFAGYATIPSNNLSEHQNIAKTAIKTEGCE